MQHIKKNRDPKWEEEFHFVCEEPPINEKLHVEVYSKPSKVAILSSKVRHIGSPRKWHWILLTFSCFYLTIVILSIRTKLCFSYFQFYHHRTEFTGKLTDFIHHVFINEVNGVDTAKIGSMILFFFIFYF